MFRFNFMIMISLHFPEIPGLLSTMWQTLGQINSHHCVSTATGRSDSYAPYHHHSATNQDRDFSPQMQQEALSVELSGSWGPLGSDEEDRPGANMVLGNHMGEEGHLCSQTDMEELRRSQCSIRDTPGQVRTPQAHIWI